MTTFYFIRHGEYDGNLDNDRLAGRSDARGLNPCGAMQVLNMSSCFKKIPISLIYSSPVKRAIHTAEIIAKKNGTRIREDDRISEISYGIIEGMKFDEIKAYFEKQHVDVNAFDRFVGKPPEGESFEEVFERVKDFLKFLEEVAKKDPKGNYIIVTHLAIIHAIIILISKDNKRSIFEYTKSHPIANASLTKVQYENNSFKIETEGKIISDAPEYIKKWIAEQYPGHTDLFLHLTYSGSHVVSFTYNNEEINAKFYFKETQKYAEKNRKINDYLLTHSTLPVKPWMKVEETDIVDYPVVLLSPHFVSDKLTNKSINKNKLLAESTALMLHTLHDLNWKLDVTAYWYDYETNIRVDSVNTWHMYLKKLLDIRMKEMYQTKQEGNLLKIYQFMERFIDHNISDLKKRDMKLLHGDFYPANLCIQENEVKGMYDFDMSLVGHTLWDLGMLRESAETYRYPQFAEMVEEAYVLDKTEKQWVIIYSLFEIIGSYTANVLRNSNQQEFEKTVIEKYKKIIAEF